MMLNEKTIQEPGEAAYAKDSFNCIQALFAVLMRTQAVKTVTSLLTDIAFDLVIVTVPEHKVEPLLPQLSLCAAKTVSFMFNTFRGCDSYRAVVGEERFVFGFPNMAASLDEHRLSFCANGSGMVTTLTEQGLVSIFENAGLPAEYETDMDTFLRSHVALAVPLFLSALTTWECDYNLTWHEARKFEKVWNIGLAVVKSLGHPFRLKIIVTLSRMPSLIRTAFLWMFSRTKIVRQTGAFGPEELRWLLDGMVATLPFLTAELKLLRP